RRSRRRRRAVAGAREAAVGHLQLAAAPRRPADQGDGAVELSPPDASHAREGNGGRGAEDRVRGAADPDRAGEELVAVGGAAGPAGAVRLAGAGGVAGPPRALSFPGPGWGTVS